jgi:cell volume regulation protein A
MAIEPILLVIAILLIISIGATRFSSRLGVPALALFLAIGMLAGSEGFGGIAFDNPWQAQTVGIIALMFILFSGGLDTDWQRIRPVLAPGLALANVGVLLSAVLVGSFAVWVLGFSWIGGLLLGAIVSSTDAAAVFALLRTQDVRLRDNLEPLIELESGSNDPMAVFLTIGLTNLIITPSASPIDLLPSFVLQMILGASGGILMGWLMTWAINHIRLQQEGLYAVFTLAMVLLSYATISLIGGNGFLAIYIAGITLGNQQFVHKRSIVRFHEGVAWLMQIGMFLILGLLVFPSHLLPVIGDGLMLALFLVFVARPISVFIALIWTKLKTVDKLMISWAGLRGAVPIVLATFPLLAGVPSADRIFNLIFFAVLISVILQGTSIGWIARLLGVNAVRAPLGSEAHTYVPDVRLTSQVLELEIQRDSPLAGKAIIELGLPRGALVIQIQRDDKLIVPNGGTVLQPNDRLLVVATPEALPPIRALCMRSKVMLREGAHGESLESRPVLTPVEAPQPGDAQ